MPVESELIRVAKSTYDALNKRRIGGATFDDVIVGLLMKTLNHEQRISSEQPDGPPPGG